MSALYAGKELMTMRLMQSKGWKPVPRFQPMQSPGQNEMVDEALAQEVALVAAAQTQPCAFLPLYQRYMPLIYRYCYLRMGNREAAEDATSEAFLKALANLKSFSDGSFAAWLFRITRNIVMDYYRQRRQTLPIDSAANELDPTPAAEELFEAKTERQQFLAALHALTDDRRTVIELTLAGWSGQEIAQALNKTPAAVKMERYRALNQVRDFVRQKGLAVQEAHHERS
jgi:RNA polymerase sigma-70 factor, ECF subfamily